MSEEKRTLIKRSWTVEVTWSDDRGYHKLNSTMNYDASLGACDIGAMACIAHGVAAGTVISIEVSDGGSRTYRIDEDPESPSAQGHAAAGAMA